MTSEQDSCDIQNLKLDGDDDDDDTKPPTIPLRGPTTTSIDIKTRLQKECPECLPNYRAITSYLVMSKECEIKSSITKLEDHLYLGGQSATNLSLLKQNEITHIINTVENDPNLHKVYAEDSSQAEGSDFVYLKFSAEDSDKYPIMDHFQDVFQFIEDAEKMKGRCLIHCVQGINRSGVLATAYIMKKYNIGPFAAVKTVQRKRGRILTNNSFIAQLLIYANENGLLEKDGLSLLQSQWAMDHKIFKKGIKKLNDEAPECIPFYNIIRSMLDQKSTIRLPSPPIFDVTPSMITEYLYLGNLRSARNVEELKSIGITHVINTIEKYSHTINSRKESQEYIKLLYEKENMEFMGFTSDDDDGYPILDHFQAVYDFIEKARKNNGKCLIHCVQGRNRSGVLATAYVMIKHKIDPISAVEHVVTKRNHVLSNGSFLVDLLILAKQNNLLIM